MRKREKKSKKIFKSETDKARLQLVEFSSGTVYTVLLENRRLFEILSGANMDSLSWATRSLTTKHCWQHSKTSMDSYIYIIFRHCSIKYLNINKQTWLAPQFGVIWSCGLYSIKSMRRVIPGKDTGKCKYIYIYI